MSKEKPQEVTCEINDDNAELVVLSDSGLDTVEQEVIVAEEPIEYYEVFDGKVLDIKRDMPYIDFRGVVDTVLQMVNIADVASQIKKGTEYVVQIPAKFQAGIDVGKYWIMEGANDSGKLWPYLMKKGKSGRNEIVTPLEIKEKKFIDNNPARNITENYHNLYLKQQMKELAGLIETTLDTVKRIEKGQLDDKIGLLGAGRQGVILALSQADESSRTASLIQARNNINIAQNQILEHFKRRVSEFEPLPKSKVMLLGRECAKAGYLDGKDDEYGEILDYYNLYLQATRMLAGTYVICGDVDTAKKVFELAQTEIGKIDFSALKTIENSHINGDEFDRIYDSATEYLETEEHLCLTEASEYDCLTLSFSGEELLEVLGDGRTEEIPKQEAE